MKIVGRTESREQCVEAGWFAFDYHLDEGIDIAFIKALRPLGSFLFMDKLAKPFFKIENDNFMIKGILGDDFFRVAVHGESLDELNKVESFVANYSRG